MLHAHMLDTPYNHVKHTEQKLIYSVRMNRQERLQVLLDDSDMNQSQLSKEIGVTRATVSAWLSGETKEIKHDNLDKLAKLFKTTIDWIEKEKGEKYPLKSKETLSITYNPSSENKLSIQNNAVWTGLFDLWDESTPLRYDEVALPFFREVELSAGNGNSEVIENHGAKLRFSKETLRHHNVLEEYAACVTVKGNSMEPCLRDGATVGIDTSTTKIINGEMYAIDHQGHLRVKMLYKMPGEKIRIRSYNSDEWPDEIVNQDDIRVIGAVFGTR